MHHPQRDRPGDLLFVARRRVAAGARVLIAFTSPWLAIAD
jgi:hypothetical protein